jgi:hypothetical protein
MATFTVHTPGRVGEALSPEKIVFLRDGFSWWAFLLGPLWLLWNRAFVAAGAWTALLLLVALVGAKLGAGEAALSLISLGLGLALGFEGSQLVAWTLARRGFSEAAVVSGEDATEAEMIFFHNWRPENAPASGTTA